MVSLDAFTAFPEELCGRFSATRVLGQGSYGVVWQARDTELDRSVALKLLRVSGDSEARRRFVLEALLAAKVVHPSVVRVFDAGVAGSQPYIVYEFVPGSSLRALLAERCLLDEATALRLGAALAEGLEAVHAARVVHRDIKPENVLLHQDGSPCLADLGIAKDLVAGVSATRTGCIICTPVYAAPEVASGRSPLPASDLYSLGVVLFEMLAGRPPFTGSVGEVLHAHACVAPPPLGSEVHAATSRLIMSLLAKDPEARPGPAGRVVAELQSLVSRLSPASASVVPIATGGASARDSTDVLTGESQLGLQGHLRSQCARSRVGRTVRGAFLLSLTLGLAWAIRSWSTGLNPQLNTSKSPILSQPSLISGALLQDLPRWDASPEVILQTADVLAAHSLRQTTAEQDWLVNMARAGRFLSDVPFSRVVRAILRMPSGASAREASVAAAFAFLNCSWRRLAPDSVGAVDELLLRFPVSSSAATLAVSPCDAVSSPSDLILSAVRYARNCTALTLGEVSERDVRAHRSSLEQQLSSLLEATDANPGLSCWSATLLADALILGTEVNSVPLNLRALRSASALLEERLSATADGDTCLEVVRLWLRGQAKVNAWRFARAGDPEAVSSKVIWRLLLERCPTLGPRVAVRTELARLAVLAEGAEGAEQQLRQALSLSDLGCWRGLSEAVRGELVSIAVFCAKRTASGLAGDKYVPVLDSDDWDLLMALQPPFRRAQTRVLRADYCSLRGDFEGARRDLQWIIDNLAVHRNTSARVSALQRLAGQPLRTLRTDAPTVH